MDNPEYTISIPKCANYTINLVNNLQVNLANG